MPKDQETTAAASRPRRAGREAPPPAETKKKGPKRPLSAFFHFSADNRENVKQENPGISFGQVGKKLGEKWKSLSETDRKPYEKKAAADKERYEKEKKEMDSK